MTTTAQNLERKFQVWKTVRVGGKSSNQLIQEIIAVARENPWTNDLVRSVPKGHRWFGYMDEELIPTRDNVQEIPVVRVTSLDLGILPSYPVQPSWGIFGHQRKDYWSAELWEAAEAQGLDFLPAEAGPHLWQQYSDQPEDETLVIPTRRRVSPYGYESRHPTRGYFTLFCWMLGCYHYRLGRGLYPVAVVPGATWYPGQASFLFTYK
jgi:hypothetical protein